MTSPGMSSSTRDSGDTVIAQATEACDVSDMAEIDKGEVVHRSTNVLTHALRAPNGTLIHYYDLEQVPVLRAAEHMSAVADQMGVDPYDIPTHNVRPLRQGGGFALPLGVAWGQSAAPSAIRFAGVSGGFVAAYRPECEDDLGEFIKYAIDSFRGDAE